jgi:hypothetical protein
MSRSFAVLLLSFAIASRLCAQSPAPQVQSEKRGWFSRMLHPLHGSPAPNYKDARLRGLILELKLSPQPIKLSEVRQLQVRMTLTNLARRPIGLDFPSDQRIEIRLLDSTDSILTQWSENHAFADKVGTVLINPQEHIEYAETIATRDLTPNRVFTVEVFFPQYPELRIRQKFMTAP